ncbi:hypothetical protein [Shimia ponticola]|uniref:hypothetical protein n=1 Tax=Shimia ponticola TaxID=2582893 RepID=UPI0011BE324B|nr:hypothetical protein [Shimia ponticola]
MANEFFLELFQQACPHQTAHPLIRHSSHGAAWDAACRAARMHGQNRVILRPVSRVRWSEIDGAVQHIAIDGAPLVDPVHGFFMMCRTPNSPHSTTSPKRRWKYAADAGRAAARAVGDRAGGHHDHLVLGVTDIVTPTSGHQAALPL